MLQNLDPLTVSVSFSDSEGVESKFLDFLSTSLGAGQYEEYYEGANNTIINDYISLHKLFKGYIEGQQLVIQFYHVCKVPDTQTIKDLIIILSSFYVDKNNDQDRAFIPYLETHQQGLPFLNSHVIPLVLDDSMPYEAQIFKFRSRLSPATRDNLFLSAQNSCSDAFLNEWLDSSLIAMIQEDFKITLRQHLQHQNMIPIIIQPRRMLQEISKFVIKEVIQNQDVAGRIESQIFEGLEQDLINMETSIEEVNSMSCRVLSGTCDLILNYMENNQDTARSSLQSVIQVQLIEELRQAELPDFMVRRSYEINLILVAQIIIDKVYQLIEDTIEIIIDEDIECAEIHTLMADLVEMSMCSITVDIKHFALVHCAHTLKLFNKLKEMFSAILQNIALFLFKISCLANSQMETLNEILAQYSSLANLRTFQVLQMETSHLIIDQASECLREKEFFFFRPELAIFEDKFIKHSIRSFYTYSTLKMGMYKISDKTKNFGHVMTIMGMEQYEVLTILEGHQGLWFQRIQKPNTNSLFDSNVLQRLLSSAQLCEPILNNPKRYTVTAHQDVFNSRTGRLALSILLEDDNGQLPSLIMEIDPSDLNLVLHTTRMLSVDEWQSQSEIFNERVSLNDFIQDKRGNFEHYNTTYDRRDSIDQKAFNKKPQTQGVEGDDIINYRNDLQRKRVIRPAKPYTKNALAGGSIGAGIGCLIVDSLDPNLGWNEKMKRAGFTTVTTGVMGVAFTIPIIGVLLQQGLMVYALNKVMGNQVLSGKEKAKNIGHIGVQSTVGIGFAAAGQILIPLPILGAIIGATIGGVAVGFYQKFVIPSSKSSLLKMIKKLDGRIMPDGLLVYDDRVISIMKINQKHFKETKPEALIDSEWLTVVTVYLINEMLFLLNPEEEMAKVQEGLLQKPEDKSLLKLRQEQVTKLELIESINSEWDMSRKYIAEHHINTLENADSIGTFVDGMMKNFRL